MVCLLQRERVVGNWTCEHVDLGALRLGFASPISLFYILLCIGDNHISFCWGWGKWKVSARVKSE